MNIFNTVTPLIKNVCFQIELQEREEKKEREKKVEALRKKQEEKRLAEEAEKVKYAFLCMSFDTCQ